MLCYKFQRLWPFSRGYQPHRGASEVSCQQNSGHFLTTPLQILKQFQTKQRSSLSNKIRCFPKSRLWVAAFLSSTKRACWTNGKAERVLLESLSKNDGDPKKNALKKELIFYLWILQFLDLFIAPTGLQASSSKICNVSVQFQPKKPKN